MSLSIYSKGADAYYLSNNGKRILYIQKKASIGRCNINIEPSRNIFWWGAPVPGCNSFTIPNSLKSYYPQSFGQCTWWAQYKRQDEYLEHMGDAKNWANGARGRGYRTGFLPMPNSTVVFQPGVAGAGKVGHVGHVEKVFGNGWFLVSEMNFRWNGQGSGGFQKVDYRYVHNGRGISFIY